MNLNQVQAAVYEALNVPALTDDLSQGYGIPAVFSEPAVQAHEAEAEGMFPYVTFSIPSAPSASDKGASGVSALVQVDCYARGTSWQPVRDLARIAWGLLHRQEIDLANLVTVEGQTSESFIDPDGRTMRVMMQFRVLALA